MKFYPGLSPTLLTCCSIIVNHSQPPVSDVTIDHRSCLIESLLQHMVHVTDIISVTCTMCCSSSDSIKTTSMVISHVSYSL